MAYDKLDNTQLSKEARVYMNMSENAMQGAMRRQDELIRRQEGGVVTPTEPAPEPVPEPDPFEGEQPEPIPDPVPVIMPEGQWVEQPTPIVSFTNEQIASLLKGTLRDPSEPRPLGMTEDPNGAFRFLSEVTHIGRFDPVAYPGQEVAGHLHDFHGNSQATFESTYASLRAEGELRGQGGVLNRSLYWSSSLTAIRISDGRRVVLEPTYCNNYYKAVPDPDTWHLFPEIAEWAAKQSEETKRWYREHPLAAIPDGLRYFAGYRYGQEYINHTRLRSGVPELKAKRFADLDLRPGDELKCAAQAPSLWMPPHVDSPDHMAHVKMDKVKGYIPVWWPGARRIPGEHHSKHYKMPEGLDLSTLALSSDLQTGQDPGTTFHVGYWAAWEPEIMARLHHHSIELHGNNSSANIGDGTRCPGTPITYEAVSRIIEWEGRFF